MDTLYTAVIALLAELFNADYPLVNTSTFQGRPIFQGYENNYTVPATGKYVILTSLEDANMSLKWESYYNSTTRQNTYATMMSTQLHVDMYGDNAEDNARILSTICQNGYANQFWFQNDYGISVHKVKSPRNLSDIFGREMYNKRFLVMLELFNNVATTLGIPNFDELNVNLKWVNNKN